VRVHAVSVNRTLDLQVRQDGINYRRDDLEKEVMRLTQGRGVDVVFENIGDPTLWPGVFNGLARGGRLVTAGAHGGGLVTLDWTSGDCTSTACTS